MKTVSEGVSLDSWLYGVKGGKCFGGACLPKDVKSFNQFCKDMGLYSHFLNSTISVNQIFSPSQYMNFHEEPSINLDKDHPI
jgi:UDP-glucose 6-dehydrogenase